MFEQSVATPSIWASMNNWFTPTVFFVLVNVMIGIIAIASSLTNHKQQHPDQHQDQDHQQHQHQLPRSPSVLQRLRSINFYSHRSQEPRFQLPPHNSVYSHFPPPLHTHLPHTQTRFDFPRTHEPEAPETQTHFISEEPHREESAEAGIQFRRFEEVHQPEGVTEEGNRGFVEGGHEEEEKEDDVGDDDVDGGEDEEPRSLDEVYSQLAERRVGVAKPAGSEEKNQARKPGKFRKSVSSKALVYGRSEEEDSVEARRPATMREGNGKVAEEDEEVDAKADDFINRFKQQLKLQRLDSITRTRKVVGSRATH